MTGPAVAPVKAGAAATSDGPVAEFIYTLRKVRKAHGDKVVLDDVTLSFLPGAKIGVVGPNGAGKSSVLRIMAGLDQPNNGDAFLAPGATVGILQQEPPLNEEKTVRGNVEEGLGEIKVKLDRFNEVAELMATDYTDELMEEMGRLQEELDHADAWDLDSQLEQAMDALRCPPPDEPVTHLSGGERRRVALCKLLLSKPDLLLLDEPTNHLDAESVQWLEQHLADYKGAILAVTHDRYFLDNVAEWILEIDRGRCYPYEGNYSTYLEKKAERLEVSGKKDQKLQRRLKEELAWVRSGAAPVENTAMLGIRIASTARVMAEPFTRATTGWKRCSLRPSPPRNIERPRASSRLAITVPVMLALTMSTSPARRATKAMMSSEALPKTALSRAPRDGPKATDNFSVAMLSQIASGRIASPEQAKTTLSLQCSRSAARESGTSTRKAVAKGRRFVIGRSLSGRILS